MLARPTHGLARWTEAIDHHLEQLRRATRAGGSSSSYSHNLAVDWFVQKHVKLWRTHVLNAESARLHAHAALFDEFLPNSTRPISQLHPSGAAAAAYTGRFSAFDYFEPEYSCALETRTPMHTVGDGPKWQCGVSVHPPPCRVVSIGSNFDDSFERGMHHESGAARCTSYIVDPTIAGRGGAAAGANLKLREFEASLRLYNASLNTSVGVGFAGGRMNVAGGSAPLVPLDTLLRDRFAGSRHVHVAVLKVDGACARSRG